METKFMRLAKKKWDLSKIETDIRERDKLYDQVDICRQFARFSEEFGEGTLKDFFKEITEWMEENATD